MNAHIPQSIPALAETSILMRAEAHIVSGQSSAPVNGIVQDGLNAAYIMTNTWDINSHVGDSKDFSPYTMIPIHIFKECIEEAGITEERCTNMLIRAAKYYPEYISLTRTTNRPVFKKKKIPGKLMASILFPPNLNYKRYTETNSSFPMVEIENGILVPNSGPLCKKVIGAKANSLIHILWLEYSPDETLRFISDCQQITDRWFPNHGFSMGIWDCMASSDEEVAKALLEMKLKIGTILEKCGGIPNADEELDINSILNSAMNVGLKLSKTSMAKGDKNALNIMRNSGGKGSLVNLTQIVAFVGQQNINGQRIPLNISGKTRALPHFQPNDHSAEARGFVGNGYLKGLTPAEVFFHAAAGRTGIISTSIKSVTRETLITIYQDDFPITIQIGEWIDVLLLENKDSIQKLSEKDMEYLDITSIFQKGCSIPTVDEEGNVTWGAISAVTRHDPTENLYKITTRYGREVIVAESKSLVVWNKQLNKWEQNFPQNVKKGDMLPVTRFLPEYTNDAYGIKKYLELPEHYIENPHNLKKIECTRENGYLIGAIISSCGILDAQTITLKPRFASCKKTLHTIYIALKNLKLNFCEYEGNEIGITSIILKEFVKNLSGDLNILLDTPLYFKEGIIDGYLSFGASFSNGRLKVEDNENYFIPEYNFINMLCNQFGVVTKKIDEKCFTIKGIYITILKHTVGLTNSFLHFTNMLEYEYCGEFIKDVHFDPIKKIEKIKTDGRKLYDMTVPSTLNFCLANGLHVADTSDTGYIQKKIGRKIEDCKAYIDGTVRTSNGRIIQFLYGDDGMNPKFLYVPKGLHFPFFINPINIALRLNSDAVQKSFIQKGEKPRELLEEEIELMLSYIHAGPPYLKSEVIEVATDTTRSILRKLLLNKEVILYECMIPDFCVEIKNMYEMAKIQYGEMVGLHTASFIGEPTTQMTLDAFHNTGVKGKDISLGVPRFNELLNATKSNKQKKISQTIHLEIPKIKENASKIKEWKDNSAKVKELKTENLLILEKMKKNFLETKVGTFVQNFEMKYLSKDVNPDVNMSPIGILTYEEYEERWWVSLQKELSSEPIDFEPQHWVVILYFDIEKLYNLDIELEEIAIAIENDSEDKYYCCASPLALGEIEVYCNFSVMKEFVKAKLPLPEGESSQRVLLTTENINYFVCRDVVISYLLNIKLSGIVGVKKVFSREVAETGEWVIDTDCREIQAKTSIQRFLDSLTVEGVDPYNTIVDDMHTLYATLGIEAARKFLIEELTRIISFDGVYINPRHIQLLADSMTYTGEITSVRRDGISREVGPNAKIMFEQAVDNAVEASAFSEIDDMKGVSSAIMYGLTSKAGTGMVEIKPMDQIPVTPSFKREDLKGLNVNDLEEVKEEDEKTSPNKIETPIEKKKRVNAYPGSRRKNVIRKRT